MYDGHWQRVVWAWDLWMQATEPHEAVARVTGNPARQSTEAHPYCCWEAQCLSWNLFPSRTFFLLVCIHILFYVWVTLVMQNRYHKSWVHWKGFRSFAWPVANQLWVQGLDCFQDELDTLQRGLAHNIHMELCSGWKKRVSPGQLPLLTQIPGPEPALPCTARAGCQCSLPCLKF